MVMAGPPKAEPERLIGRPTWRWFDLQRWGKRRVGVAAVLVVYAALATINALTVPPFLPRDETGHLAYVVSITHGKLPTIYTPLPKDDLPQLQKNNKDTTWVANHPPLFYVLAAVPMKVALSLDRPTLGVRLIRLMNVGFVMATMGLAAILARRVLRRSIRAPIVAAATTGLIATVPHIAAMAYNDALAMFTAGALLVAAVAVFDRGPSVRGLAWVAGCASAAALTRFTNLSVIVGAGAIVAFGVLRHTPGPLTRKAVVLGRSAALVSIPLLVSSAWFYLRNRRLYGDFTGANALFVMFHRRARGSAFGYLRLRSFWQPVIDGLWTRYAKAADSGTYGHGGPLQLGRAFMLILVFGLACALARWVWVQLPKGLPNGRVTMWSPDLALVLVALGEMVLFALMIAQFQSGGGSAHSRYLFPLLPVVGCFVALAWACLPGNRRGILSAAALVAAVCLAADLLHRFLVIWIDDQGWVGTEINAMDMAVPAAAAILMVLLLVLGVALGVAAWALIALPREQLLRRKPSLIDRHDDSVDEVLGPTPDPPDPADPVDPANVSGTDLVVRSPLY